MFTFTISTRVSAATGLWDSTGSAGVAAAGSGNCAAGFGLLLLELQEARNIAVAANSMCRIDFFPQADSVTFRLPFRSGRLSFGLCRRGSRFCLRPPGQGCLQPFPLSLLPYLSLGEHRL